MKILQVPYGGLNKGGVQKVIMDICRNMPEIQFDVLVFTNKKTYYEDQFESLGGNIYRIPNYEGENKFRKKLDFYIRFFRIFIKTYKILKEKGPYDVIHCHKGVECGIHNLAAYFAGVRVRISHAHTSFNIYSKTNIIGNIYIKFLQILMNLSSNIKISCSKKALISLFGNKYLKKRNSFIIPNPIDTTRFRKTKHSNESTKKINIVHVGRYNENKNQIFLIEILPYILREFPNAMLQLVGYGDEYKKQLQNKAISLGVESNVKFLSPDTDVKAVLEEASLFIFPSIKEGFGIALLEAQAMEVPCLVSDSIPKEVDCGLCKFLSLKEKKEVWAQEAINIIKNKHNLKLNRDKLNSLDIKNYVKKLKSIYERVIF